MLEERRDQRDLQEITQRLLEACSEIAGSSLEQTTFFRRNLAVKPGPQRDVSAAELDELTTDAELDGSTYASLSLHSCDIFDLRLVHC